MTTTIEFTPAELEAARDIVTRDLSLDKYRGLINCAVQLQAENTRLKAERDRLAEIVRGLAEVAVGDGSDGEAVSDQTLVAAEHKVYQLRCLAESWAEAHK